MVNCNVVERILGPWRRSPIPSDVALSNITNPERCAKFVFVVEGFLAAAARLEDAGGL